VNKKIAVRTIKTIKIIKTKMLNVQNTTLVPTQRKAAKKITISPTMMTYRMRTLK
jgi:hypothetical protein